MKPDFKESKLDLMPDGWYEALITDGKTDVTRSAEERWRLTLEIQGVLESKQMELALKKKGVVIEDVLVDGDSDFWRKKIRSFMRAAFPEMEQEAKDAGEGYEAPELTAEDTVGRRVGVQISIADGNPQYDEASKVNRCWRYKAIGAPTPGAEAEAAEDSDII